MSRFIGSNLVVKLFNAILNLISRPTPKPPEPTPEPPAPEPPTPTPPPEPEPIPPKPEYPEYVTDLLRGHNNLRITKLTINKKLMAAAQKHAEWMSATGYTSHTGYRGSSLSHRVQLENYVFYGIAENIGVFGSAAEAIYGWYNSDGHRLNIQNEMYVHIGIGKQNNHWCVVLGKGQ